MERLKRRTDFRAAAQAAAKGAKAPAGAFVLQARARAQSGPPRVGFTVSRQVGNAVERNRVRRRLREVVRLAPATALCAGHDYVLIGRRAALAAPFRDMVRQFATALNRVHAAAAAAAGGASGGGKAALHRAGQERAGQESA
jgi:ribonuclease P protein component